MSGTADYTTTPNLGLYKPIFNRAVGTWGDLWNSNADALDAAVHANSGGLPLSGGTMTGPLSVINAATQFSTQIETAWTPVYPVANSPTSPPVEAQFCVQGQTSQGASQHEWTAVFGNYVNTGQPNGQKVTAYMGAVQGPLGGSTWSLNTDVVRNGIPSGVPGGPSGVGSSSPGTPGAIPTANSTIGYELDFTNWDQDCSLGGAFTVGMYIHNQSLFPSLAGIYYDSNPLNAGNNNYGWHYGIIFSGQYTVEDATIYDATSSFAVLRVAGTHNCVVDLGTFAPTITGPMWNGNFSATSINSTPIGATTPAAGNFTTIATTGQATVNGIINTSVNYQTPTTGATITLSNASPLVLNPAGTLAALTIALPASPVNGQVAMISTTQQITAFMLSSPAYISGNIGAMAAGTTATFRYVTSGSLWLRVDKPA